MTPRTALWAGIAGLVIAAFTVAGLLFGLLALSLWLDEAQPWAVVWLLAACGLASLAVMVLVVSSIEVLDRRAVEEDEDEQA